MKSKPTNGHEPENKPVEISHAWPRQEGWEPIWLIFLSCTGLGLTALLLRAASHSLCLPAEPVLVCGREWLATLGPWIAVLIAIFALVPVQKQWLEMKRQRLIATEDRLSKRSYEYAEHLDNIQRLVQILIIFESELRSCISAQKYDFGAMIEKRIEEIEGRVKDMAPFPPLDIVEGIIREKLRDKTSELAIWYWTSCGNGGNEPDEEFYRYGKQSAGDLIKVARELRDEVSSRLRELHDQVAASYRELRRFPHH